jgi:hypothetical protein
LPYEMWTWCIRLASQDEPAGPLPFIMVSKNWQTELLRSPALWNQIRIQNDEDELARIWTFLHLSGCSPLDVHITTVLPTTDSIQLIKPHLSRVRTISISPDTPHPLTTLHEEQWKRTVSNVMATFSDQLTPWNATNYSCSGRRIGPHPGLYHVSAMKFSISYSETKLASTDKQSKDDSINPSEEQKLFCVWENYITRCAFVCLLYSPCGSIAAENHESIVSDAAKQNVGSPTYSTDWLAHLTHIESASAKYKRFMLSPLSFDVYSMYVL